MNRLLSLALVFAFGAVAAGDDPKPPAKEQPKESSAKSALDRFFARFDKNKDGFIDRTECPEPLRRMFDRLDVNGDGKLSREELKSIEDRLARFLDDGGAPNKPAGRPGEVITPAAKGERQTDKLKVGDVAPDFTLPDVKNTKTVTLSSFKGQRPVVLIFASYT